MRNATADFLGDVQETANDETSVQFLRGWLPGHEVIVLPGTARRSVQFRGWDV